MRLVVLGAPGAGKGTQAYYLSKRFDIPHISTGELLREHMRNQTAIGLEITELMETGRLVPDETVLTVLKERIAMPDCSKGFIIDGFPRTIQQAEISESVLGTLDKVISVHVDDEVIVQRMSGRRICPDCGKTYHMLYKPPKNNGFCDDDGQDLIQRVDDKAKTVRNRLALYHKEAEPIKDFYRSKGLLAIVDGIGEISDITDKIVEAVEGNANGYNN